MSLILPPQGYLTLSGTEKLVTSDHLLKDRIFWLPEVNLAPVYRNGVCEMINPGLMTLNMHGSFAKDTIRDVWFFWDAQSSATVLAASLAWGHSELGAAIRENIANPPFTAAAPVTDPVTGLPVNAVAMATRNGDQGYDVAAGQAVWFGAISFSAHGKMTCHVGIGQGRRWDIWNRWGQQSLELRVTDPSYFWSYDGKLWRPAAGNPDNCLTVLTGRKQRIDASYGMGVFSADHTQVNISIRVNGETWDNVPNYAPGIGWERPPVGHEPTDPAYTGRISSTGRDSADDASAECSRPDFFGRNKFTAGENVESYSVVVPGAAQFWGTEESMMLKAQWMG